MASFEEALHNKPLVLDGALATELEKRGHNLSDALWSATILMTRPEAIKQIHHDYFAAGADVTITASYQASPQGLKDHKQMSEQDTTALVKLSVTLAQQARSEYLAAHPEVTRPLFVAGSVGPYGAYLANGAEYTGDYALSDADFAAFHRTRIRALVDAGADVLACETIPSAAEARALVGLLGREFKGIKAWLAFSLRDGMHIADGTPLVEIVKEIGASENVVAVGVNCVPQDFVLPALEACRSVTDKPAVVYPNSGEQWNSKDHVWVGNVVKGATLSEMAAQWRRAGARIIGGCCRTGPQDIETIRLYFDS